MSEKKEKMTKEAARRIQSHADKTGTDQDFKARAMSAAAKNEEEEEEEESKLKRKKLNFFHLFFLRIK